jgi:hypothetical protein
VVLDVGDGVEEAVDGVADALGVMALVALVVALDRGRDGWAEADLEGPDVLVDDVACGVLGAAVEEVVEPAGSAVTS